MAMKPPIIVELKKHALDSAKLWRDAAADWALRSDHDKDERVRMCLARAELAEERAAKAPVKVMLVYEDGSTLTVED